MDFFFRAPCPTALKSLFIHPLLLLSVSFSFLLFFLMPNLPYSPLPPRHLPHMSPVCAESQQLLSWEWRKYRKLGVYQSIPNTVYRLSAVVYAFILIPGFIFILFWWYHMMYNCFGEFGIAFVELWAWVMKPNALLPTGFCHVEEDVSCLFSFRRECFTPQWVNKNGESVWSWSHSRLSQKLLIGATYARHIWSTCQIP